MTINQRFEMIINHYFDGNKRAFSNKIGVSATVIENVVGLRKGNPSFSVIEKIMYAFENINSNWLITGKGEMLIKNDHKNDHISVVKPNIHENEAMNLAQSHATIGINAKIKGNKSIMSGFSIEKVRELDPLGNYEPIPLVFHEAVAGFGGSAFSLQEHDIQAFYTVPDFKKIDFMIRINGSSMYPKYNSGDVIAVRVLHERAFIQWNKVHLIATKEQGLLVKRLKKSTNDDNIICASDNKEYDAFEVPWKEIEGVALVIGVIRLE